MDDSRLEEVFLSSETIFEGKIINVERWQVRLPDGSTAPREVVRHHGAAAVVPVDENGYVTLVRQHRVVNHRFTWEIPAGKLDKPGESTLDAAKRELSEETGLSAENWTLLSDILTTPGFCDEHIGIYLATGLSAHETHPDEDEFIHSTTMPLDEAVGMIWSGAIRDSKTIVGLLMAQRALQQNAAPFEGFSTIQRPTRVLASRSL